MSDNGSTPARVGSEVAKLDEALAYFRPNSHSRDTATISLTVGKMRKHLAIIERAIRHLPAIEAAAIAVEMRERCAQVVEQHTYKGQGTEGRNDLIGMFARGQMRAKQAITKKIRALPLKEDGDAR